MKFSPLRFWLSAVLFLSPALLSAHQDQEKQESEKKEEKKQENQPDFAGSAKNIKFVEDGGGGFGGGSGEHMAKLKEHLKDPKAWEEYLKIIYERSGIYVPEGKMNITVRLTGVSSSGYTQPKGTGADIQFNASQLAGAVKVAGLRGVSLIVPHELVHALTVKAWGQKKNWPVWLSEGVASYIAREEQYLGWIKGKAVKDVESGGGHARGYAFMHSLDKVYGTDKVKSFLDHLVNKGESYKSAAEKAFGESWDKIKSAELANTQQIAGGGK